MPDAGLTGLIRSQRPRSVCAAALAAVLLLAVNIAGCYSRVTVTHPRGVTTQDLEPGQNIKVELRDGRTFTTKFRGMKDGELISDAGRYPLDQVRTLSYWVEDEAKPLILPFMNTIR